MKLRHSSFKKSSFKLRLLHASLSPLFEPVFSVKAQSQLQKSIQIIP